MLQDDLVVQSTQGSFIPQGRDDVLTQAIGRPEHPRRVRGTGGFWGLRDYFGAPPRRTVESCSLEVLHRMEREFEEKLNSMRQEMEEKIASIASAQQQTVVPDKGVRVSMKGCCATADPSGEQIPTDHPGLCELYIEDDPPRLMAIGRVVPGGSTIHGVPLQSD